MNRADRIIEKEVIKRFDDKIQELLHEKVRIYSESSEFKTLMEEFRRKKREEMLAK